ncbi:hypothetical protein [Shewanella algae]|uniref:hypothetical protein n=1 Tax=Shewanella algae TaxID=38313 RepID=UPI0034D5E47A
MSARENAEKKYSARFIKLAIDAYDKRNVHPSFSAMQELEQSIEEQDELVEEYLNFVKDEAAKREPTKVSQTVIRLHM